jgi:alanyl-tRNA synthetase
LTAQEIKRIETVVNERVREDDPVETQVMDFQEAVRAGALAFFDDKYGDRVRVVRISDFSKELCGGTHCHETGQVGMFKLVQEGSIAAGVRRIEALTGEMAYLYVRKQEDDIREVAALLKVQPSEVVEKTRRLLAQMRDREKEMDRLKGRAAGSQAEDVASEARTVSGVIVLAKRLQDGLEPKDLRAFMDTLRNRLKTNYIAVVASASADRSNAFLITAVSADLTGRYNAGEIAKEIAGIVGGSGGGRPDMAQAGGKNVSKLPEALARVYEIVGKKGL